MPDVADYDVIDYSFAAARNAEAEKTWMSASPKLRGRWRPDHLQIQVDGSRQIAEAPLDRLVGAVCSIVVNAAR
jgi:hypothetical protein